MTAVGMHRTVSLSLRCLHMHGPGLTRVGNPTSAELSPCVCGFTLSEYVSLTINNPGT
jgi:hypothetical protein